MNPSLTSRQRLRDSIIDAVLMRLEDELAAVLSALPTEVPQEIREKIRQKVIPDARFHLGLLTLRNCEAKRASRP